MSYSFQVRAATKAVAKELITTELANIATAQPVHAADVDVAQAAAETFLDLAAELPEVQDYLVTISGSVVADDAGGVHMVSFTVSVGHVQKLPDAVEQETVAEDDAEG